MLNSNFYSLLFSHLNGKNVIFKEYKYYIIKTNQFEYQSNINNAMACVIQAKLLIKE